MLTCILNGKRINCFNGEFKKEELKEFSSRLELMCPECGKPYEYCHGLINRPYFRHKGKCDYKIYSEPETEEHIEGKVILFEWLKSIQKECNIENLYLEYFIKEANQKPDIYFEQNGNKYAIEYQCTPIASDYLKRRSLYSENNIKDIWILGEDKYKNGNGTKTIEIGNLTLNKKNKSLNISNLFYGNTNDIDITKLDNLKFEDGKIIIKDFVAKSIETEIFKVYRNKISVEEIFDKISKLTIDGLNKEIKNDKILLSSFDEDSNENCVFSFKLLNTKNNSRLFVIKDYVVEVYRKYYYNPTQSEKSKHRSKYGRKLYGGYKTELLYNKNLDVNNYFESLYMVLAEEINEILKRYQ